MYYQGSAVSRSFSFLTNWWILFLSLPNWWSFPKLRNKWHSFASAERMSGARAAHHLGSHYPALKLTTDSQRDHLFGGKQFSPLLLFCHLHNSWFVTILFCNFGLFLLFLVEFLCHLSGCLVYISRIWIYLLLSSFKIIIVFSCGKMHGKLTILTIFKCTVQWHWVLSHCCATITTICPQLFSSFPTETLYPSSNNSSLPCFPAHLPSPWIWPC